MSKKRVFVGLSGGVDSSVAAKRLLDAGYDVVGVFIKVWHPDFIRCDWEKERLDAMRVAAHLGIPFLTCDAEDAYKKDVADYMIEAYRSGLTPNPDVMCNEHVKFGAFYTWARAHGADFIATGHYAQKQVHNGIHTLHAAIDPGKDQSYFLARMDREVLPYVLFPIGDSLKSDVRKEAERHGIPTFAKADSQGICFLGQIDMHDFLGHFITLTDGVVLNEDGKVIGTHSGALLYTIGQRHGFTVIGSDTATQPHYVVRRDLERNELIVSTIEPTLKLPGTISLTQIRELGHGIEHTMDAVLRYHGARIPVTVTKTAEGGAILEHDASETITPSAGQLCVLYRDTECCGSGIIV